MGSSFFAKRFFAASFMRTRNQREIGRARFIDSAACRLNLAAGDVKDFLNAVS
jgi:hypothetical protein